MKSRKSSFTAHQKKIKIEGFGLHKLISECLRYKIQIRDLHFISDIEAEMLIKASDFGKLRKLAKSRFRITVVSESGYIPFLFGLKARKAMLAGMAIFFVLLYYQSTFVSEIRIYGYQSISESEIRSALREVGFTEGAKKLTTKEEVNKVKLHLFEKLGNISWVGITYDGKLAEVTIVEGGEEASEMEDTETACNIIADKSGYVVELLPMRGVRAVSDGAFVAPGDILISGIVPITSSAYGTSASAITEMYVHAKGEVKLRVPYFIEFKILQGIVDSRQSHDLVSASYKDGESEYDFVKRISDKELRKYIKENMDETVQITNKHLNFTVKGNIIEVGMLVETLEETGTEQKIEIKKQEITDVSKQPI